jgi:hypothetical protein
MMSEQNQMLKEVFMKQIQTFMTGSSAHTEKGQDAEMANMELSVD